MDIIRENRAILDSEKMAQNQNCCNNSNLRNGFYHSFTEPPPPFQQQQIATPPTAPPSGWYPCASTVSGFLRSCHSESSKSFSCINCCKRFGKILLGLFKFMNFLVTLATMLLLVELLLRFMFFRSVLPFPDVPDLSGTAGSGWDVTTFPTWTDGQQSHVSCESGTANGTVITELPPWTHSGETYSRFRMTNQLGITVELCSLGAMVTSLKTPDKKGNFQDVVLGFDNAGDYLADSNPYFGSTVGRVANRISGATFTIDNITYTLAQNLGNNHLHGGIKGFDAVNWQATSDNKSVTFSYYSKNGEEGYPGDMIVFAKFTLSPNSGALNIEFWGTSTKKTPINLAHHMYFNLAGHGAGKSEMLMHTIQINAESYTPVDGESVPTGEIKNVGGTAFDLRVPKTIGQAIDKLGVPKSGKVGFDHNFVIWPLNSGPSVARNRLVARSTHPKSGRTLDVYSNQPGVQFYTGNYMPSEDEESLVGKDNVFYGKHGAFCLETQIFPDAINKIREFQLKTILNPGEIYYHNVVYKFGVLN